MASTTLSLREIEHTGDLGMEIGAGDLAVLFSSAGEALYAFIADPATVDAREEISVSAHGEGPEELLHAWLCELLAQFNLTGFVGKSCQVARLTDERVDGTVRGEKLDLKRHRFYTEIKGVTYHDFKVWQEKGGWRARVIFDV
ncbi:MAG TPA: archease [Terriglobales bacterium]|nr:archease [Terriglobales bacterium]